MTIFTVRLMGDEVHWLQVTWFHRSWTTPRAQNSIGEREILKGISIRSGNSNDDNSYASNNSYDF